MDFLNTCLNKLSSFVGIIAYPICIIPKKRFEQYINIDELLSDNEYIIVRRSEKPQNEIFDEFGWLREDALVNTYREVPGLSMNILGGNFRPRHIQFNPKGDAAKEWAKDIDSSLWYKYIWNVKYLWNTTPIFFKLSEIHRNEFPYQRNADTNLNKILNSLNLTPKVIDGKALIKGVSVLKHSPNKLNYWHIEFHLNDGIKEINQTIKGSQVKNKFFDKEQESNIGNTPWADQLVHLALNDCLIAMAKSSYNINDMNRISKSRYLKQ